jgi:Ca-activated chloride channel homolog
LDVSTYFFQIKERDLSILVLSNILELELFNYQLYRIMGYKLDEIKEYDFSSKLFRRVLEYAPHEPQSYRDLALVLEKMGNYEEAISLIYHVVVSVWDYKYNEIELTALLELNKMIINSDIPYEKIPLYILSDFIYPTPIGLRVVAAWDTDNTDIDLHTVILFLTLKIEPSGNEVYYGNKTSKDGGQNSRDFTQGYGPEWYIIRKPKSGTYRFWARYYSSHQQSLAGATTISLTLFTNYQTKKEESQQITIRLTSAKDKFDIGEIKIK